MKALFLLTPSLKGPSSEACLLPRTSLPPAAALPRKGSMKSAATGVQVPSKPTPTSPLRLPKDCHRSLGDLKVKIVDRIFGSNNPLLCKSWQKLEYCLTVLFHLPLYPSLRWPEVWWLASCSAPNATYRPPPSMLGTQGRGQRGGLELTALPPTTCPWNKYDNMQWLS